MKPTFADLKKAIKIARKGKHHYPGLGLIKYDQDQWCGTACCVWGHAMLVAGHTRIFKDQGTVLEKLYTWGDQSNRHLVIATMLGTHDRKVLPILEKLLDKKQDIIMVLLKAKKSASMAVKYYAEEALQRIEP